jgi:uncharacterized membrane protein YdbT with pleckstrin-like domain
MEKNVRSGFVDTRSPESGEDPVWQGRPSQLENLGAYVLCLLTFFLVVPIFLGFWRYLETRCTRYEITPDTLRISQGVLSRRTDLLELYRIKDLVLLEPFVLRIFSLSNIAIHTSDRTSRVVTLRALRRGRELIERIRSSVEDLRDKKGIRELDVGSA